MYGKNHDIDHCCLTINPPLAWRYVSEGQNGEEIWVLGPVWWRLLALMLNSESWCYHLAVSDERRGMRAFQFMVMNIP
jgi:hypothetical protein